MVSELVTAAASKFRNREVPGNVAAVLYREWPWSGRDGRRWTFYVTDGVQAGWVDAELPASSGVAVQRANRALLEAAIERRAINSYPVESRMDDLVSASPLALRNGDLKPHPKLGIFL
jgi:hypothetical protein